MVTMAQVAVLAGVSASTVSHVLNGTRKVNDATRENVLRAVASTGYRHNILARSLATSSPMTLGLAISSVANPYFGDLIRAIEREARAAGYMLVLADTYDDPQTERQVVEQLLNRRVDGVLLAPSAGAASGALPLLEATRVPTVLVDRTAPCSFDQVAPENTRATAQLTEHFADLGHTRIAVVAGLAGLSTSTERLAGFQQAVGVRGLDDDPALVLAGASRADTAARAVSELFSRPNRPSAVVVTNNAMTIGTVRALQGLGLRVPEDVSLVCYDDFEWAELFSPRLTAMGQDVAQMGWRAVELLLHRMGHPEAPRRLVRVAPTFQHRTSCGCPPVADDRDDDPQDLTRASRAPTE